jgi:hypothetical protein
VVLDNQVKGTPQSCLVEKARRYAASAHEIDQAPRSDTRRTQQMEGLREDWQRGPERLSDALQPRNTAFVRTIRGIE